MLILIPIQVIMGAERFSVFCLFLLAVTGLGISRESLA